MKINPYVERLRPSATLAFNQKAKTLAQSGKSIVNLTAGEPDFLTPSRIREAAKKAMDQGETHYTAVSGIQPLREAIAQMASKRYQRSWTAKNVIVSTGAKQALFNFFFTILQPSDEVIMFSPYWVSYADIVSMVGGTPVVISTQLEKEFQPELEEIKKHISSRTRAVILNSPSNPTGAVYSKKFLGELANLLSSHPDIIALTDDIYGNLIYDGREFASMAMEQKIPLKNIVVIDGVSKSYSMTGWRIGWTIADEKIISLMDNVQGQTTSNASSVSQWAALEALNGPQEDVMAMRKEFEERRNFLHGYLSDKTNVRYVKPHGAFYFFLDCSAFLGKTSSDGKKIDNDLDLSMYLLESCGVAVVPGTAFGAPNFIRISFGAPMEQLKEGISRIEKGFKLLG